LLRISFCFTALYGSAPPEIACCRRYSSTSGAIPEEDRVRERWRDYEMVFIISPLHSGEEDVTSILERLQQTIEAEGGSITAVDQSTPWGRRKLAYPIRAYAGGEGSRRTFTEGFYLLLHFSLFASRIGEVERALKLTDGILRYLITVIDRKEKGPGTPEEETEAEEELEPVPAGGAEDEYGDEDEEDIYADEEE
jgi:small subunit ribosomal protein S6